MRRQAFTRALLGLALLGLAPCAALAGAAPEELNDSVHLTDNSATNVKILVDIWRGVKIKPRPGKRIPSQEFDVSSVRAVEYGSRVAEYDQAIEAKRTGDFDKAETLFLTGLRKTKDKNQHQYFLVGLVDCYEGLKKPDEMRKHIRKMVAIKPAPRLIYDVYLRLGRSYLVARDYAAAEKAFGDALAFFEDLEKQAMRITMPGVRKKVKHYRLWSKYWKIYSLEKQGKTKIEGREGAARAYNLFTSQATGHPRLVNLARIGMARCDALIGRHDAAIKALEAIIKELNAAKDEAASGALPAAYVALGDVSFIKLDYRKARWYYLKVIVRHSGDRAAVARAHFRAGQCYEKLGASPVREREAIRRALRHYKIVKREFGDSLEHEEAKNRLRKLGA